MIIGFIAFLIHLPSLVDLFMYQTDICNFLSKIPFNVIIWHWLNVGKHIVSRRLGIFLRIVIALDLFMNVALLVCRAFMYHVELYTNNKALTDSLTTLVNATKAMLLMDVIILGGFAIWFGMTALDLRKHTEGRTHFINVSNTLRCTALL
ncbi:hypothetical protein BDF19DRAFT_431567 [Syncephalis fuscata]|nr:hypothetical protein BDF19DRAFT_431567 [Syncephalis fuscata]